MKWGYHEPSRTEQFVGIIIFCLIMALIMVVGKVDAPYVNYSGL